VADEVRFQVLGPLRITRAGETVKAGGRVQQRLLAALLIAPNRSVSDDRLVEEVWSGEPPASARHLLQVYVSRLRAVLGSADGMPRIHRDGTGYRLEVEPGWIDSSVFIDSVTRSGDLRAEDPEAAAHALEAALSLWRGRPYGDLGDDMPTIRTEADMLEQLRSTAQEDHIEVELSLGHHDAMVPPLLGLVEEFPFRERLWSHLMLALYRSGRETEALRTYTRLREMLGEELGIEPSNDVRRLEERILLQDPALALERLPAPSNLPVQLTSFVGRSEELQDLETRLASDRLVTLTGIGGIGKTRLAIAAAQTVLPSFGDGVWWIDLSTASEPREVPGRVAAALGVGSQPGTTFTESVIRAFSRRSALLLFDNCEQIVDAAAELIVDLLRGCPLLRVLATSRTALDVAGEVHWSVPPLDQPEPRSKTSPDDLLGADAIRLFVERAGAAERSFRLTAENADSVAALCRRLDGLPLAIEMAAARVAILAPAQIEDHLSDRFTLLHGPRHPPIPRHETLEAALDWSYAMLDTAAQATFDHLGVFAGSFELAAAVAVTGRRDDEDLIVTAIDHLASASLLTVGDMDTAAARYRLLETVREYALRRLDAQHGVSPARGRHAAYYLGLLEEARPALDTPDFTTWLERLDGAYEEIRQALDWSLSHDSDAAKLRGAPTLFEYWYRQAKPEEAGSWGRRMLEGADGAPPDLRAAAHTAVGFSAVIAGDPVASAEQCDEAVRLCRMAGDTDWLHTALFTKAQAALMVGDFDTMVACGNEGLELCDQAGGRWRRVRPLTVLAFAEWMGNGNLNRAAALLGSALPLYRELGDRSSQVVMALTPLCSIALQAGDVDAAEAYAIEAVEVSDYWDGSALSSLGDALGARGNLADAEAAYRRGLVRSMDVGLENWFRVNVRKLAALAATRGEHERAAHLWGASTPNYPGWGAMIGQPEAAEVRSRLGDDVFENLAAEGASWDHDAILLHASSASPAR
jgi:predicted ATPase/DNA-binding SARP family transcriptional activator